MAANPLVSVVIITRNRPQALRACLEHLCGQDYAPYEVIVVDSSSDEASQATLDDFPEVRRVRVRGAHNNMPQARNLGISRAAGEIVAFVDDDSMVRAGWLGRIAGCYQDPATGAVGGRVVDEYEDSRAVAPDGGGAAAVGQLAPCYMVANFGLDTGQPVAVDHLRGCNMSFRRTILLQLGGFDPGYGGPNTMEDTDMCWRVKRAGYQVIFEPGAVCDHLSVRWRAMQRRPPGLGNLVQGYGNQAYFWFKHYGLTGRTARHAFGGLPLLHVRRCLRQLTGDNFRRALAVVPGGLLGLYLARRHRRGRQV